MNTNIEHISSRLITTFEEDTWFGASVMSVLSAVEYQQANEIINGANSIGHLVNHIVQWRVFVIEKLKGNASFDIELGSPQDWPKTTISSEQEWSTLIDQLKQSQQDMLKLLSEKDDEFLKAITLGKEYTNQTLLVGIIEHDIYHLGQIAIVAKMLRNAIS